MLLQPQIKEITNYSNFDTTAQFRPQAQNMQNSNYATFAQPLTPPTSELIKSLSDNQINNQNHQLQTFQGIQNVSPNNLQGYQQFNLNNIDPGFQVAYNKNFAGNQNYLDQNKMTSNFLVNQQNLNIPASKSNLYSKNSVGNLIGNTGISSKPNNLLQQSRINNISNMDTTSSSQFQIQQGLLNAACGINLEMKAKKFAEEANSRKNKKPKKNISSNSNCNRNRPKGYLSKLNTSLYLKSQLSKEYNNIDEENDVYFSEGEDSQNSQNVLNSSKTVLTSQVNKSFPVDIKRLYEAYVDTFKNFSHELDNLCEEHTISCIGAHFPENKNYGTAYLILTNRCQGNHIMFLSRNLADLESFQIRSDCHYMVKLRTCLDINSSKHFPCKVYLCVMVEGQNIPHRK
jgi:hypothetical protein